MKTLLAAQAASGGAWGKIPQKTALAMMRRVTAPALNLLPAIHTCMHGIIELVGCIGIDCYDGVQRVIAVLPTHPVLSLAASLIWIASLKHMLALCHTAISPSMDTDRYMYWLSGCVGISLVLADLSYRKRWYPSTHTCRLSTAHQISRVLGSHLCQCGALPFAEVKIAWPFSHLNSRWGSTNPP
jgi:hypothetical protein